MKCLLSLFLSKTTQLQPCRAQSRMMIVDGRSCEPVSTRLKLRSTARQWKRKRNEENSESSEIWWSWLNSQWKETCENLRRVRFRWGLPNGFAIADGQSLHLWVKANSELLRFWDSFFDTKKRNQKNRNQKSHFWGNFRDRKSTMDFSSLKLVRFGPTSSFSALRRADKMALERASFQPIWTSKNIETSNQRIQAESKKSKQSEIWSKSKKSQRNQHVKMQFEMI